MKSRWFYLRLYGIGNNFFMAYHDDEFFRGLQSDLVVEVLMELTTEQEFQITVFERELCNLSLDPKNMENTIRDLREIVIGQYRQLMAKENVMQALIKLENHKPGQDASTLPDPLRCLNLSLEQEFNLAEFGQSFDEMTLDGLSQGTLPIIVSMILNQCAQLMIRNNLIAYFQKKKY
jgi:hypothetical protein